MSQFGPGIVAGFLGAEVLNNDTTVWFHAKSKKPLEDIHFVYDGNNIWLQRIKDIYRRFANGPLR